MRKPLAFICSLTSLACGGEPPKLPVGPAAVLLENKLDKTFALQKLRVANLCGDTLGSVWFNLDKEARDQVRFVRENFVIDEVEITTLDIQWRLKDSSTAAADLPPPAHFDLQFSVSKAREEECYHLDPLLVASVDFLGEALESLDGDVESAGSALKSAFSALDPDDPSDIFFPCMAYLSRTDNPCGDLSSRPQIRIVAHKD